MAHSTTPAETPPEDFPTAENRAIANFTLSPTNATLPQTPNTTAENRISLLPPMASLGGSKVPLAAPTATPPGIPDNAELQRQRKAEEEEREKVEWCERYNDAQPGGRGMISINDPDYLEIMKVWRAEQATKAAEVKAIEAEKKAREPVVKAIVENDDGGVQMNRPSIAEQEQARKKMRKREKVKKWIEDLI